MLPWSTINYVAKISNSYDTLLVEILTALLKYDGYNTQHMLSLNRNLSSHQLLLGHANVKHFWLMRYRGCLREVYFLHEKVEYVWERAFWPSSLLLLIATVMWGHDARALAAILKPWNNWQEDEKLKCRGWLSWRKEKAWNSIKNRTAETELSSLTFRPCICFFWFKTNVRFPVICTRTHWLLHCNIQSGTWEQWLGRREEASSELERVNSIQLSRKKAQMNFSGIRNRICSHPQEQYCMEYFGGCERSNRVILNDSQEDNLRENLAMSQCPGGESRVIWCMVIWTVQQCELWN